MAGHLPGTSIEWGLKNGVYTRILNTEVYRFSWFLLKGFKCQGYSYDCSGFRQRVGFWLKSGLPRQLVRSGALQRQLIWHSTSRQSSPYRSAWLQSTGLLPPFLATPLSRRSSLARCLLELALPLS